MTDLWHSLAAVFTTLWAFLLTVLGLLGQLSLVLLPYLPLGLWCAFWLLCVNWKRLWPFLARGAWVAVVLLGLISALVWSKVDARTCNCLGFMMLPNFWWQVGSVAALVGVALFFGWLQGVIRYSPPDINVEMPTGHDGHGHDHHHGHAHGHH
jgi:hypothetical protein